MAHDEFTLSFSGREATVAVQRTLDAAAYHDTLLAAAAEHFGIEAAAHVLCTEEGLVPPAKCKTGPRALTVVHRDDAPQRSAEPDPTAYPVLSDEQQLEALVACSALYTTGPIRQPRFLFTGFRKQDAEAEAFPVCGPCAHSCFGMQDIEVEPDLRALRRPFGCACCNILLSGHRCCWKDDVRSGRLSRCKNLTLQMRTAWATEQELFLASAVQDLVEKGGEAVALQQLEAMTKVLRGRMDYFEQYFDPLAQSAALDAIPVARLTQLAADNPSPDPHSSDEVLKQLLHWFKRDFFKWVDKPDCAFCATATTDHAEHAGIATLEEKSQWASVVELYQCSACQRTTRFPRYNRATKLLTWRRGRCGEWTNCFALCAISMGYDVRFVEDLTDHVWVEVYSVGRGRWIHCDPCEDAFDAPLMYETGWGKALTYIFAVSREEVVDVTRRYTGHPLDLKRTRIEERQLSRLVRGLNHSQRQRVPRERTPFVVARAAAELSQLALGGPIGEDTTGAQSRGRSTGSDAWRTSRGEAGVQGPDGPGSAFEGLVLWDLAAHHDTAHPDALQLARTPHFQQHHDGDNAPECTLASLASPDNLRIIPTVGPQCFAVPFTALSAKVTTAAPVRLPVPQLQGSYVAPSSVLRVSASAALLAHGSSKARTLTIAVGDSVRVAFDFVARRAALHTAVSIPVSASAWATDAVASGSLKPEAADLPTFANEVRVALVLDATGALAVDVDVVSVGASRVALLTNASVGTMVELDALEPAAVVAASGAGCALTSFTVEH